MASQLTIWCNAGISDSAMAELRAGTEGHRLVFAGQKTGNLASGGHSPELVDADVAFGQPDPDQSMTLSGLRWVHLTSAGYTRYDRDDFRQALISRGAAMTNSSSVFDEPCAQHMLAFMLAMVRRLPDAVRTQELRTWEYERLRYGTGILDGQTVLILGFGAIGRRLAELLAPFRLEVIAVRRRPRGDEPIKVHPIEDLDRLLPLADHIANVLPASASTERLLTAERFALCKFGARFYNVGRGTTLDQDALIANLESGRLGGAYLDVTDPEPLPPDHPLWTAPNCYITPHTAGGHTGEDEHVVRHFLKNLRRFEEGQPLLDRVF
jgi:phosphoglycerate dehydrogenase-like enzyme